MKNLGSEARKEVFGEKWYLKMCKKKVELEVIWKEVGGKNSKNFIFWGLLIFTSLKMLRM